MPLFQSQDGVVLSKGLWVRLPWLLSWLDSLLPVCPQANWLTPLNFSFPICEVEIIVSIPLLAVKSN